MDEARNRLWVDGRRPGGGAKRTAANDNQNLLNLEQEIDYEKANDKQEEEEEANRLEKVGGGRSSNFQDQEELNSFSPGGLMMSELVMSAHTKLMRRKKLIMAQKQEAVETRGAAPAEVGFMENENELSSGGTASDQISSSIVNVKFNCQPESSSSSSNSNTNSNSLYNWTTNPLPPLGPESNNNNNNNNFIINDEDNNSSNLINLNAQDSTALLSAIAAPRDQRLGTSSPKTRQEDGGAGEDEPREHTREESQEGEVHNFEQQRPAPDSCAFDGGRPSRSLGAPAWEEWLPTEGGAANELEWRQQKLKPLDSESLGAAGAPSDFETRLLLSLSSGVGDQTPLDQQIKSSSHSSRAANDHDWILGGDDMKQSSILTAPSGHNKEERRHGIHLGAENEETGPNNSSSPASRWNPNEMKFASGSTSSFGVAPLLSPPMALDSGFEMKNWPQLGGEQATGGRVELENATHQDEQQDREPEAGRPLFPSKGNECCQMNEEKGEREGGKSAVGSGPASHFLLNSTPSHDEQQTRQLSPPSNNKENRICNELNQFNLDEYMNLNNDGVAGTTLACWLPARPRSRSHPHSQFEWSLCPARESSCTVTADKLLSGSDSQSGNAAGHESTQGESRRDLGTDDQDSMARLEAQRGEGPTPTNRIERELMASDRRHLRLTGGDQQPRSRNNGNSSQKIRSNSNQNSKRLCRQAKLAAPADCESATPSPTPARSPPFKQQPLHPLNPLPNHETSATDGAHLSTIWSLNQKPNSELRRPENEKEASENEVEANCTRSSSQRMSSPNLTTTTITTNQKQTNPAAKTSPSLAAKSKALNLGLGSLMSRLQLSDQLDWASHLSPINQLMASNKEKESPSSQVKAAATTVTESGAGSKHTIINGDNNVLRRRSTYMLPIVLNERHLREQADNRESGNYHSSSSSSEECSPPPPPRAINKKPSRSQQTTTSQTPTPTTTPDSRLSSLRSFFNEHGQSGRSSSSDSSLSLNSSVDLSIDHEENNENNENNTDDCVGSHYSTRNSHSHLCDSSSFFLDSLFGGHSRSSRSPAGPRFSLACESYARGLECGRLRASASSPCSLAGPSSSQDKNKLSSSSSKSKNHRVAGVQNALKNVAANSIPMAKQEHNEDENKQENKRFRPTSSKSRQNATKRHSLMNFVFHNQQQTSGQNNKSQNNKPSARLSLRPSNLISALNSNASSWSASSSRRSSSTSHRHLLISDFGLLAHNRKFTNNTNNQHAHKPANGNANPTATPSNIKLNSNVDQINHNYEPLIPESGFKIVVMGTSGSGKTAIIQRFLYDSFSVIHTPTVEDTYFIEFPYRKQIINISISDTSGEYNFYHFHTHAFSLAEAVRELSPTRTEFRSHIDIDGLYSRSHIHFVLFQMEMFSLVQ